MYPKNTTTLIRVIDCFVKTVFNSNLTVSAFAEVMTTGTSLKMQNENTLGYS